MAEPRFICAGEVMLEMAALPEGEDHFQQGFAGDSYNTAVYLARAGISVDYFTRLGDDDWSSAIIAQLQREGIGSGLVARVPGRLPGLYLIRTDSRGERQFSYWRGDSPARQLFDQLPEFESPAVFYFTGITLAVCRTGHGKLIRTLARLQRHGCHIVFDPNYRPRLWDDRDQARHHCREVLSYCHTVLPTLEDEKALWDIDTVADCHQFYRSYDIEELVIKAPCLTIDAFTREGHCQRQAEANSAVDTTGAGDAFNAGYLASRYQGASVEAAIGAAQDLAARVVMQRGAILPRDED